MDIIYHACSVAVKWRFQEKQSKNILQFFPFGCIFVKRDFTIGSGLGFTGKLKMMLTVKNLKV